MPAGRSADNPDRHRGSVHGRRHGNHARRKRAPACHPDGRSESPPAEEPRPGCGLVVARPGSGGAWRLGLDRAAGLWEAPTTAPGAGAIVPPGGARIAFVRAGHVWTAAIVTSTDPTGASSSWNTVQVPSGAGASGVSCPSVSLCAATTNGADVLTSTNPTGGANAWTATTVDTACADHSTPCISERLYVRDDSGTRVVDSAAPGDGNSIGNVVLGGDSLGLSWTDNGILNELQLR